MPEQRKSGNIIQNSSSGEGLKLTNGTQLTTGENGSVDVQNLMIRTSSSYTTNGTGDRIGSGSVENGAAFNVGKNAVVNLGKGTEDLFTIKTGGTLHNSGVVNVVKGSDVVIENGGRVSNVDGLINVEEGSKVQNDAEIKGGNVSLAEGSSFITTERFKLIRSAA